MLLKKKIIIDARGSQQTLFNLELKGSVPVSTSEDDAEGMEQKSKTVEGKETQTFQLEWLSQYP